MRTTKSLPQLGAGRKQVDPHPVQETPRPNQYHKHYKVNSWAEGGRRPAAITWSNKLNICPWNVVENTRVTYKYLKIVFNVLAYIPSLVILNFDTFSFSFLLQMHISPKYWSLVSLIISNRPLKTAYWSIPIKVKGYLKITFITLINLL